jgi:Transposase DDE domain
MSQAPSLGTFRNALAQFLTPQVRKQAHQACRPRSTSSLWSLQPLVWVLLTMTWCLGQSPEERFAAARAVYVAHYQRSRRPGTTLTGFLTALAKLPLPVLRVLARGVRQRLGTLWVEWLRLVGGWVPLACDGSRVECARSAQLQQRLGEAGKPGSAPTLFVTTLELLPLGVVWSWWWGKGTASEIHHLRRLLPTLPRRALIVADAGYLGYELFQAIVAAQAAFLVRLSSRAYLYTAAQVPLTAWTEGLVYYWPKTVQDQGLPPLTARLLRIKGPKADVWLLTSVLEAEPLSRPTAGQVYRWRWRNEGLFRDYKRLLQKVKLGSRTVALVHREAEGAMLALQLLLALAVSTTAGRPVAAPGSPRQELLRLRGAFTAALRSLGRRQFAQYQQMLGVVRNKERPHRVSAKVRQPWTRRAEQKPPKPPKLREMSEALKAKLAKKLEAA